MTDCPQSPRDPLVSIITPFYNEAEVIDGYFAEIFKNVDGIKSARFEIICVDDGSRDTTLEQLRNYSERYSNVVVIELSRNFGKEAALTAGIRAALGDAIIIIDADLQDPPELIPEMIAAWKEGADVVLARRVDRRVDSLMKRKTAEWFYRLHNSMSSTPLPDNVGDFRLMNREAVDALNQLDEQQRFMKGLFAWVGFKTKIIDYSRRSRHGGTTKFSGWKLWNFALEGITSFSTMPLRVWGYLGVFVGLVAIIYAGVIIVQTLVYGIDVPGYASIMVVVLMFGSLNMISIGVLGEYVGRIYLETKRRPSYIVRRTYGRSPTEPDKGLCINPSAITPS